MRRTRWKSVDAYKNKIGGMMSANRGLKSGWLRHVAKAIALAFFAASLFVASGSSAWAYMGYSWVSVPGATGHWAGKDHHGWMRADASSWYGRLPVMNSGGGDILAGDRLFFGGPNAAHPGSGGGKLILGIDKDNPDLPWFMAACANKTVVPEMGYAEDVYRARPFLEAGPKPANLPDAWEYSLKNVQVVDCPVAEGADQQAFVLAFKDIAWLNYDPKRPMANKIVVGPKDIPDVKPVLPTGKKMVKSFLITWIAPATTTTDDQCPVMNAKPTDADYYRYKTPEEIAAIKAKVGEKGITAGSMDAERRGPNNLNVTLFPGTVPDPGLHSPVTNVADGLNLDGNDGNGAPSPGIRQHKNYTAPDGRTGIDNQLFDVMGCIAGMRGRRGYLNQTHNARRADGNIVTLVQISNITNEQNDPNVEVSIIHSMDKPVRDSSNTIFLPNNTFRPTTDPNYAMFNYKVHGRIVNGVVTTDIVPILPAHTGQGGVEYVYKARLRFVPKPDGSMQGLLAGYEDWRHYTIGGGYSEGLFGFNSVPLYYALKRDADGMKNPVTGDYDGISMAWDIDTVPAFLVPAQPSSKAPASP
jgi:hypothetical protein